MLNITETNSSQASAMPTGAINSVLPATVGEQFLRKTIEYPIIPGSSFPSSLISTISNTTATPQGTSSMATLPEDSFFTVMAEALNKKFNQNFSGQKLYELCIKYYLADYKEKADDIKKAQVNHKRELEKWYKTAGEYSRQGIGHKRIKQELDAYARLNFIAHPFIEGRVLLQFHKMSKYKGFAGFEKFRQFYITFIIGNTKKLYKVDRSDIIAIDNFKDELHLFCVDGSYQLLYTVESPNHSIQDSPIKTENSSDLILETKSQGAASISMLQECNQLNGYSVDERRLPSNLQSAAISNVELEKARRDLKHKQSLAYRAEERYKKLKDSFVKGLEILKQHKKPEDRSESSRSASSISQSSAGSSSRSGNHSDSSMSSQAASSLSSSNKKEKDRVFLNDLSVTQASKQVRDDIKIQDEKGKTHFVNKSPTEPFQVAQSRVVSVQHELQVDHSILATNPYFLFLHFTRVEIRRGAHIENGLSSLFLGVDPDQKGMVKELFQQHSIVDNYIQCNKNNITQELSHIISNYTGNDIALVSLFSRHDPRQMAAIIKCLARLGWLMPCKLTQELLQRYEELNPNSMFIPLINKQINITGEYRLIELCRKQRSIRLQLILPKVVPDKERAYLKHALEYLAIRNEKYYSILDYLRNDVHYVKSSQKAIWIEIKDSEHAANLLANLVKEGILHISMLSTRFKHHIRSYAPTWLTHMESSQTFNPQQADYNPNVFVANFPFNRENFDKSLLQNAFQALKCGNLGLLYILTGGGLNSNIDYRTKQQLSILNTNHVTERYKFFVVFRFENILKTKILKLNAKDYLSTILNFLNQAQALAISECLKEFENFGGCFWPNPAIDTHIEPLYIYDKHVFQMLASFRIHTQTEHYRRELLKLQKEPEASNVKDQNSDEKTHYYQEFKVWIDKIKTDLIKGYYSKNGEATQRTDLLRTIADNIQRRETGIIDVLKCPELLPEAFCAIPQPLLRELLSTARISKARIDSIGPDGLTLLEEAVVMNNQMAAIYLIENGASIKNADYEKIHKVLRERRLSSDVISFQKLIELESVIKNSDNPIECYRKNLESTFRNHLKQLMDKYILALSANTYLYEKTIRGQISLNEDALKQRCEYLTKLEYAMNVARVKHDDKALKELLNQLSGSVITGFRGLRGTLFHQNARLVEESVQRGNTRLQLSDQPLLEGPNQASLLEIIEATKPIRIGNGNSKI